MNWEGMRKGKRALASGGELLASLGSTQADQDVPIQSGFCGARQLGVIGRRSGLSRTRSREPPKLSRESESIEDPLVLLAGVRTPIGREPIAPPDVGQLAQLQHRDSRSWSAATEPSGNVLFRPEEIHVASSEDDVFPPRACRDQAMEAHRGIAGSLASDRYP